MSFASLRDSIRATKDVIYMNTGFTGPSPEPVLQRMREVFEKEASVGPASVEGLAQSRAVSEEARATVASYFNADADEVTITHGTTEGLHVAIYGMQWGPGDEFVSCSLEHPALATPSSVLEQRYGVTVKRVDVSPAAGKAESLAAFKAALSPKTKLVAISHVQYSCGLKLPAKEIIAAAHEAGAMVALDGAQTGGHFDIDVARPGCRLLLHLRPEVGAGPERDRRAFRQARAHQEPGAPVHHQRHRRCARYAGRCSRRAQPLAALPHSLA